jgi:hypothetical protein
MATGSFLKPKTIRKIRQVSVRGFETKLALSGGGTWISFSRWSEDAQRRVPIAPQLALVEFANTQMDLNEGVSAESRSMGGMLSKLAPFDVERDDLFTIGEVGSEEVARIEVVYPEIRGVTKASFTLILGEE